MAYELESIEKAKGLLKKLFRSDSADLDFGIYRIMNFKRAEIEKFIDKDLVQVAKSEFKEFAKVGVSELESKLAQLREEINGVIPETIDENWNVLKNQSSPKVHEFIRILAAYNIASVSEEQVQDVFNHIYEFFSRYYEDGDFIPKTRFAGANKYFLPYNGEEILLYWATRDMYYVKTSEFFNKYSFNSGKFQITFVLLEAKIELSNIKGEKKYFLLNGEDPVVFDENSGKIEIRFNYRVLSDEEIEKYNDNMNQEGLIDRALDTIESCLGSSSASFLLRPRASDAKSLMRKHLEAYVRRNTKDFFIHKNIQKFLLTELDFYLNSEVQGFESINNLESETKLIEAKKRAIRGISTKIVEFLAQVEEFQKRLFEKKKLVLRTDYCITLDMVPDELFEEIGRNKEQVREWKELYCLDTLTQGTFYETKDRDEFGKDLLKQFQNLVLDTRHFEEEFKWRLLSKIDELDEHTEGLIVKSENFQCLHLFSAKFDELIGGIYIDPPYNTGKDGFLFKDQFFHSSWLTMMANTAKLSQELLRDEGVLLCSIGNQELHRLIGLLENTYGEANFLGPFIWVNEGNIDNQKKIKQNHEYVLAFAKNEDNLPYPTVIDPNIPKGSKLFNDKIVNTIIKNGPKNPISVITLPIGFPVEIEEGNIVPNKKLEWPKFDETIPVRNGKIVQPMKIRSGWSSRELLEEFIKNDLKPIHDSKNQETRFELTKDGVPYIIKERSENQGHVLTVLQNMGSTQTESSKLGDMGIKFSYPKPSTLIKYLISALSKDDSIILDYFAGSGPVAEAVLELNQAKSRKRRYILVEMDECFDSVLKSRIKKLMFSREWKSGVPVSNSGYSHIMKYQYLEQYEDTLNNIEFARTNSGIQSRLDSLQDYFIRYMLDFETKGSSSRMSFEKFKKPFDYKIKILDGGIEKEQKVDLIDTFNYLLGLRIQRIRGYRSGDILYKVVIGTRENKQVVVIWRDTTNLDLKLDKEFIEKSILDGVQADTIYVNGDSYLENATPIEPEFKNLMGA